VPRLGEAKLVVALANRLVGKLAKALGREQVVVRLDRQQGHVLQGSVVPKARRQHFGGRGIHTGLTPATVKDQPAQAEHAVVAILRAEVRLAVEFHCVAACGARREPDNGQVVGLGPPGTSGCGANRLP
jgi:hypothetical protein